MKKKSDISPSPVAQEAETTILTATDQVKTAKKRVGKTPKATNAEVEKVTISPKTTGRSKTKAVASVIASNPLDATQPLNIQFSGGRESSQTAALNLFDLPPAGKTNPTPNLLNCQRVECAYASDVGQVRDNNEDNLGAFMALVPGFSNQELLFGFFVVADGMGGYERGEVASQLAVQTTIREAIEKIYLQAIAGKALGGAGETTAETLVRIIAEANNVVAYQASRERNTMGTTLVCALMVGDMIYTGNIGDSRLYGVRRHSGELEQITTDHSVVQRLVETGQLTPDEALNSPQRSLLYRSLGQHNAAAADTTLMYASDYSHLMLCSDGLWDMVADDVIGQILRESETAASACRRLINIANQNGGSDNVSTIVVKLN